MAAGRLLIPGWMPALDEDGNPIPNARVFFYLNKTSTLAAVFSDEAMTVPLANPVPSNASGRFPSVWADDSALYSASVDAPYGPAGIPFTYDDLSASMAADILVAGAAEAAADEAQQTLVEIQAAIDAASQAGGGDAAVAGAIAGQTAAEVVVAGKANRNGSNVEADAFRGAIDVSRGFVNIAKFGGGTYGVNTPEVRAANKQALIDAMAYAKANQVHIQWECGTWHSDAPSFMIKDILSPIPGAIWAFARFMPGWNGTGKNSTILQFEPSALPLFRNDATESRPTFVRWTNMTILLGYAGNRGRGFIDVPNTTYFANASFEGLQIGHARVALRAHLYQSAIVSVDMTDCDYGLILTEGTTLTASTIWAKNCKRAFVIGCDIDIDTDAPVFVNNNGVSETTFMSCAADGWEEVAYTFGVTQGVTFDSLSMEDGSGASPIHFPFLAGNSQVTGLSLTNLVYSSDGNPNFAALFKVGGSASPVAATYPVKVAGAFYTATPAHKMIVREGGDYTRQLFDASEFRVNFQGASLGRGFSTDDKMPTQVMGGALVGHSRQPGYLRTGATYSHSTANGCQDIRARVRLAAGQALYIPVTKIDFWEHLAVGSVEIFPCEIATSGAAAATQSLSTVRFSAVGGSRAAISSLFKSSVQYHANEIITSAAANPDNLVNGAQTTLTFSVPGVTIGDMVDASFSLDLQGVLLSAYVSSNDNVRTVWVNTTGTDKNLAAGTVYLRVVQPKPRAGEVSCALITDANGDRVVKISSTSPYGYFAKIDMTKNVRQDDTNSPAGWYVDAA